MISAVVLAKNNEDIIERCLQSVSWCDEIIVVDDYSTDDTVKIAKKCGARVFIHLLDNNFAQVRNFALDKAKGDWVLFIDSDEIVSAKLKQEIQNKLRNSNCYGFYLKRTDYFLGRWLKFGETGAVRLLRLGKKGFGQWERKVHEIWKINREVGQMDNPILHYPHKDITSLLTKINFYSVLHSQEQYESGCKSGLLKIIFYPIGKLLYNLFVLRGIFDREQGIIMALSMSLHSFLAASRLYLYYLTTRKK